MSCIGDSITSSGMQGCAGEVRRHAAASPANITRWCSSPASGIGGPPPIYHPLKIRRFKRLAFPFCVANSFQTFGTIAPFQQVALVGVVGLAEPMEAKGHVQGTVLLKTGKLLQFGIVIPFQFRYMFLGIR